MTMESEIHPAARQMSFQVDDIVIENLSSILAPTLMIVGSEDKRFIGAKNYMLSKVPHSSGAEVQDARHSVIRIFHSFL